MASALEDEESKL